MSNCQLFAIFQKVHFETKRIPCRSLFSYIRNLMSKKLWFNHKCRIHANDCLFPFLFILELYSIYQKEDWGISVAIFFGFYFVAVPHSRSMGMGIERNSCWFRFDSNPKSNGLPLCKGENCNYLWCYVPQSTQIEYITAVLISFSTLWYKILLLCSRSIFHSWHFIIFTFNMDSLLLTLITMS